MNMRADFDTFAAELLDQIEVFQALSRALATTPSPRDTPFDGGRCTRMLDVGVGELHIEIETLRAQLAQAEQDRDAWRAKAERRLIR